MDITDKLLIQRYIQQFGAVQFKGKKYLRMILEEYVTSGCVYDLDKFLSRVCETLQVKPKSVLNSISRYVHNGWDHGFHWEWHTYVDWDKNVPPQPRAAVQWLCEHYVPFVNKYQDILETTYSYYLRIAVEKTENNGNKETLTNLMEQDIQHD